MAGHAEHAESVRNRVRHANGHARQSQILKFDVSRVIQLGLSSDHDEQHLEPDGCFNCVRATCRQDDGVALLQRKTLTGDLDGCLSVSDHN